MIFFYDIPLFIKTIDQRPPKSLRCRQDQHECGETCIFGNQICDGNYDCPDRSDETMCQGDEI